MAKSTRDQIGLPGDPTGIVEAHDVLAAEDFAMPSGPDRLAQKLRGGGTRGPLTVLAAAAALAAVLYAALKRR